jgi:hypothetical protein
MLLLDRQLRYGTGIQYKINGDMSAGFAWEFLDGEPGPYSANRGPLAETLKGRTISISLRRRGLEVLECKALHPSRYLRQAVVPGLPERITRPWHAVNGSGPSECLHYDAQRHSLDSAGRRATTCKCGRMSKVRAISRGAAGPDSCGRAQTAFPRSSWDRPRVRNAIARNTIYGSAHMINSRCNQPRMPQCAAISTVQPSPTDNSQPLFSGTARISSYGRRALMAACTTTESSSRSACIRCSSTWFRCPEGACRRSASRRTAARPRQADNAGSVYFLRQCLVRRFTGRVSIRRGTSCAQIVIRRTSTRTTILRRARTRLPIPKSTSDARRVTALARITPRRRCVLPDGENSPVPKD